MKVQQSLLLLAAGMGSRYGGLKQIDPVGPHGETILDYSVYDAIRAGFGKLVFVIRKDIERAFKETVGSRFENRIAVDYVFQELNKLPTGFTTPSTRVKPWGTGHALLMGADALQEPFAAVNADDFYGRTSFQLLGAHLQSGSDDFAMAGFTLRNTLSEFGAVARGVCQTSSDGYLTAVKELTRIERDSGAIQHTDASGNIHRLTGDEPVSLNTWGFTPAIFPLLRQQFAEFLNSSATDDKAEFFIPTAVNNLIATGQVRVKVLATPDSWFGVTYKEDRPHVVQSIRALIQRGDYPEKLWDR